MALFARGWWELRQTHLGIPIRGSHLTPEPPWAALQWDDIL